VNVAVDVCEGVTVTVGVKVGIREGEAVAVGRRVRVADGINRGNGVFVDAAVDV
jgi:hypothetical protein